MRHLSPEQFIDALDGTAAEPVREHAESCESCGTRLEELRALARMAESADVPEPSPLFWDHFSARVQAAVAAEAAQRPRASFLGTLGERLATFGASWRVLVPVTVGVGALAIALWVRTPQVPDVDSSAAAGAVSGVTASHNPATTESPDAVATASAADAADDESLAFVADLASGLDWSAAAAIGLTPSDGVESTVVDLDDAERAELRRILNEAIGAGVSM